MPNGLNIPNNLYTLGAVEFDSRPSTNLYIQLQRQKQARDEALDNYEQRRMDRINEAGLRDQDREGLDNLMLDLRSYYNGNKDAIRRGNTPQAYDYEKRMRDALGYISESKERTAKSAAMEKYRQERLKQGRSTTEDFWNDYQAHELPIRTDGSQSMQLEKYLSQQTPVFKQKEFQDLFKDVKRTPQSPRYEAIPGDKFNRNEFIDEKFDDAGMNTIVWKARLAYDENEGFANAVQQDINNPMRRGQLEKLFTDQFGTAPKDQSDYAVAKTLEIIQPTITGKPKKVEDWEAKQRYMQANKERNIRLSAALRPSAWGFGSGASDAATGNEIDRTETPNLPSPDYTGDWNINGVNIPKQTRAIIKSGGVELSPGKTYRLKFENGEIKEVRSADDKELILTRDDVEKAQKKYDTERKGEGQRFGVTNKPKTNAPTMVTVVLKDGRKGEIPSDKVAQFLKDNPGSKKQ